MVTARTIERLIEQQRSLRCALSRWAPRPQETSRNFFSFPSPKDILHDNRHERVKPIRAERVRQPGGGESGSQQEGDEIAVRVNESRIQWNSTIRAFLHATDTVITKTEPETAVWFQEERRWSDPSTTSAGQRWRKEVFALGVIVRGGRGGPASSDCPSGGARAPRVRRGTRVTRERAPRE